MEDTKIIGQNYSFKNRLAKKYLSVVVLFEKYLFSLLILFMRLHIGKIFFYSGLTKISSWNNSLYLFQYEYKVPFMPYELAAYLSTIVELAAPIFLLVGFMTRLAAIPVLFMVGVIQFTYLQLNLHLYWALLLACMIFYGPGRFSLDYMIYSYWGFGADKSTSEYV